MVKLSVKIITSFFVATVSAIKLLSCGNQQKETTGPARYPDKPFSPLEVFTGGVRAENHK